jgi:alkaline phosphatase
MLFCHFSFAQSKSYSTANAHSHNDYENPTPFFTAYNEKFGSIEADIFLWNDSLLVGHTVNDLRFKRTLQQLYLDPLAEKVKVNYGYPYKDSALTLQLLIDIKTEAVSTLKRLTEILQRYPSLIACDKIHFVITGNRPNISDFPSYPNYILFDGELNKTYTSAALQKVALFSDDLKKYTTWNGKGIFTASDKQKVDSLVALAHATNKPIRFWDAPDFVNAWYQLIHADVDYINTDHITDLSKFLQQLNINSYSTTNFYPAYIPTYHSDGVSKKVKDVILLIGDGCSWPQLYAGYTANHANLNIFNIKNIGLSKTSSYDSYITDSAPGSTSISSGIKTNNRFVGVDHTGAAITLLPAYLSKRKIKTGLITCGDITDATPADFYAHQKERDSSIAILKDLINAPVDVVMGSGNESVNNVKLLSKTKSEYLNPEIIKQLMQRYSIVHSVDSINNSNKKWIAIEKQAGLSFINGRGSWLQKAFQKGVSVLSKNSEGFFMMIEGAQIDYGGHANNLPYVVTEVLDFDQVVGEALRFADSNNETLVIVTADHETGGLTLLDGKYSGGYVSGNFSTNDHTALPVPVFAYGPMSESFKGVYENTELFHKILNAIGIPGK